VSSPAPLTDRLTRGWSPIKQCEAEGRPSAVLTAHPLAIQPLPQGVAAASAQQVEAKGYRALRVDTRAAGRRVRGVSVTMRAERGG
jgi:hypothetical protein